MWQKIILQFVGLLGPVQYILPGIENEVHEHHSALSVIMSPHTQRR
jgi:hypothetical protein